MELADLFPNDHDLPTFREALASLATCERAIRSQGPTAIIQHSTSIYTCSKNMGDLKMETVDEIFNCLTKGLGLLEIELKKHLNDKLTDESRLTYMKTIKIFIYLLVEYTNFVERKMVKASQDDFLSTTMTAKKNVKRKKQTVGDSETSGFDWNLVKEKFLDTLAKVLLLNIQKLWTPPLVEEHFVELVTNMCYKLLENSQITKTKQIREHICHILSLMIKKYNHSYGACVMIIQTLSHYEHLNQIYADLIETCVKQLGYESILPELLREFKHHINSLDQQKPTNAGAASKENPNMKFYSQFLVELGERLTVYLRKDLTLIIDYLDEESYLMRNSVLSIFGEIIIKGLNSDDQSSHDLNLKQIRNEILDLLCDHIHDTNALTRSKTLQIWRKICDENKLPLQYQNEIMKRCVGRMDDCASSVRKSAFQLLCDMIKKNPYGIKNIQVSLAEIESQYKKELDVLNTLKEGTNSQVPDTGKDDQDDQEPEQDNSQPIEQIVVQTTKVNYLKDMLNFIRQIETAIPKLTQLLFSKTQTDVIEVISFFVTCYQHGFIDMLFGIRKMLTLLLTSEKTISDAVINAYRLLYLDNSANDPVHTAMGLIKLTYSLTISEYDALEQLVGAFAETEDVMNKIVQVLWEIFAQKSQVNQIKDEDSCGAIILLSMIIKKQPLKGKANLDVLIEFGLNTNEKNLFKVQQTCIALTNMCATANTKSLDLSEPFKLPNTHKLFENITEIILKNFSNQTTIRWIPLVQHAIECIYKLADNPMNLNERLIFGLMEQIGPLKKYVCGDFVGSQQTLRASQQVDANPGDQVDTDDQDMEVDMASCSSTQLTRFISFVGFTATKLLVFLNTSFVCEIKRRKQLKENADDMKKQQKKNNKANKRRSKSTRQSIVSRKSMGNDNDLLEEMGLQGAEAEDNEQLLVEHLLDTQVTITGLLSKLLQYVVVILKEPGKYSDENLQLACSTTLLRIMCLSRNMCVDHLQFLFTILEKSYSDNIRSQLILGIGDLVYRFPNALEPWTPNLYMPLRDRCENVRINTLRLLSHLILKEMIKTKGQIAEIALCTIDDNPKVVNLAKNFYTELAKRNNGLLIYNTLPDMISILSNCSNDDVVQTQTQIMPTQTQTQRQINEESFRKIISYLFSFIKKDRQCETFVEKLAKSFRNANTERKCRDLAFCLSKINISDSGIKKLYDTFKFYEDKLCILDVSDIFKQILKNAKKIVTLRVETKKLIDEFEKKIDETLEKGVEDNPATQSEENTSIVQTNRNSNRSRVQAPRTKKKQPVNNKKLKKRAISSSEEDASTDSSSD